MGKDYRKQLEQLKEMMYEWGYNNSMYYATVLTFREHVLLVIHISDSLSRIKGVLTPNQCATIDILFNKEVPIEVTVSDDCKVANLIKAEKEEIDRLEKAAAEVPLKKNPDEESFSRMMYEELTGVTFGKISPVMDLIDEKDFPFHVEAAILVLCSEGEDNLRKVYAALYHLKRYCSIEESQR